jgi:hypothetical protein
MSVLSAADRSKMSSKEFAGPGKSFPVNDANHARLAISGATRSEHAGNISSSEEDTIKAEARAKLGDKGGDPAGHKAAVAKMHPEHVHKLVQDAHAGKYGPQAQQAAQSAMQPQGAMQPQSDNDMDDNPAAPAKSSMFSSGGGAPAPAPTAPPAGRASMFGSGR